MDQDRGPTEGLDPGRLRQEKQVSAGVGYGYVGRGDSVMTIESLLVRIPLRPHGNVRNFLCQCLSEETLNRWSLPSGVYARVSKCSTQVVNV